MTPELKSFFYIAGIVLLIALIMLGVAWLVLRHYGIFREDKHERETRLSAMSTRQFLESQQPNRW